MKISEIIVKLHHGRIMKKVHAQSVADVVRTFGEIDEDRSEYRVDGH
jgi:FixJ family two-component response regulator